MIFRQRRFEYDVRVGADRDKPAIDLELTTHTVTTDFTWDASSNLEIQAGVLGRDPNNCSKPRYGSPETNFRITIKYDFGAFLIGEYRLKENWLLEAGIRYDYNRIDARNSTGLPDGKSGVTMRTFPSSLVGGSGNPVTDLDFDYHNLSASRGYAVGCGIQKFGPITASDNDHPTHQNSSAMACTIPARIEFGHLRIGTETSHRISIAYNRSGENAGGLPWSLT